VTRWQNHLLHIGRVPSRKNQTAVVGVSSQLVNDLSELVYSLTSVIRLGVNILGTEVSPLEAIHWSQIANLTMLKTKVVEELAGAIAIPNLDTGIA